MSSPLLSSESVNVIQESTDDDPTIRNISSRTKRDFVHFMRDFNILETAVGFIISFVLLDFIKSLVNFTIIKYIGVKNTLLNNTISLLIIILLLYLFVEYIFYTYLYTKDIAKEEVIKKALSEKKVEVVKKNFDRHINITNAIKQGTDLTSMDNELYKESFIPKKAFASLHGGYLL